MTPRRLRLALWVGAAALLVFSSPSLTFADRGSATGVVADDGVPEPVAVMPFQNLNQDEDLDWLSVGMAETMLSDLRREGMRIVMRDALDTAIAEMALQGVRITDESSAARIGRLVGAKTMVFGGYQTAAGQVRITARFVEVETSLVLDAAMVTGPITSILDLQDEIVAKLLGREPTPPTLVSGASTPRTSRQADPPAEQQTATKASQQTHPSESVDNLSGTSSSEEAQQEAGSPKRPTGEDMVAAYRKYSMSLTTSSDAERIAHLQRSIELNEKFVYAVEDLRALEKRLREHRRAHLETTKARADRGMESVLDESIPEEERSPLVFQILNDHLNSGRFKTLADSARKTHSLGLPSVDGRDPTEYSSYMMFFAYQQIDPSLALQVGEQHMEAYPGGHWTATVNIQMPVIMRQLESAERQRREAEQELEDMDDKRRALEDFDNPKTRAIRSRNLDLEHCRLLGQAGQSREAIEVCKEFISEHADALPSTLSAAVLHVLHAYQAERRFDEGRSWAIGVLDGDPPDEVRDIIRSIINLWPQE